MTKQLSTLPPSSTTTAASRRPRRLLSQQLGCTLGLLLAGCAERYDIGAVGDAPQELQTGDAPPELAQDTRSPLGVLLADGIEDAHASVEANSVRGVAGDLDGDGFDDVMVSTFEEVHGAHSHVLYGGPRPADGVVRLGQRSTALLLPEDSRLLLQRSTRGDFDGDGTNDVVFSSSDVGSFSYALADDEDYVRAAQAQFRAAQQALLWLGGSRRPEQVDVSSAAVAFGDRDDLPSHFVQELAQRDPAEAGYDTQLSCQLSWLGDLDGDGLDDLALSTVVRVAWFREDYGPGYASYVTTRRRQEAVSYIYYGGAQLVPGGDAPEPDARLAGVRLTGMGDVNGDGFTDVAVTSDDGSYYALPGRAQRLTGEANAQQLAVPLPMPWLGPPVSAGDLDGDGISDLITVEAEGNQLLTQLVYGSTDLLDRPLDAGRVGASFYVDGLQYYVSPLGDYDGDGASDLLFGNTFFSGDLAQPSTLIPTRDELRLIRGGAQRFAGRYEAVIEPESPAGRESPGLFLPSLPAGDFDGDGRVDLLMTTGPADQRLHIMFGGPLPERPLH